MTETDSETVVYTATGLNSSDVYHTDEDCFYLQQAGNYHKYSFDNVGTRAECQFCAGTADHVAVTNHSQIHDRALQLDPEEVFDE